VIILIKEFYATDYNPEDLLQSGLDHLSSASILIKSHPFHFDSAGYLAHMGLELIIKSWILYKNSKFKGIHPLPELIEQIKRIDTEFSLNKREQQTLVYLSKFKDLRYPCKNDPVEIGSEDIEQIYELADKIWQNLPEPLIQAYENIPQGRKGNRVIMKRPSDIPRNLEFERGIK
jgi:HEPN domain-containing protein